MIFTNRSNVDEFFETVDKCEDTVELITEWGDRFNLKATLTKYVILVKILSSCTDSSIQIKTYNHGDEQKLKQFMANY